MNLVLALHLRIKVEKLNSKDSCNDTVDPEAPLSNPHLSPLASPDCHWLATSSPQCSVWLDNTSPLGLSQGLKEAGKKWGEGGGTIGLQNKN